ncbi:hypothetical protein HYFRA_00006732 [Hymenoscyphus fraxineus]|uniref:Uncharacterized protein n=1 Tax=Hymenoscyphus fraxineus TaxID=746836 RepID=A0A9N9PS60_9HELO|nr:hypothetical protein HYFRA_00006732 [Hymenoscyphus fraxineus]
MEKLIPPRRHMRIIQLAHGEPRLVRTLSAPTTPTHPPPKPPTIMSANLPIAPLDTSHSSKHIHTTISPTRPRHQVTRSISEFSAFPKLHRQHHHHHPHVSRHHKDKEREKEGSQSAGANSQSVTAETGMMSEVVTPSESRDASRRTSFQGTGGEDGDGRERVKEGEVLDEMERGEQRAIELRNAILNLNTLSNNTTMRLDNTYYAVLEKLSVLQNTITSMKELATMTRNLNEEFKAESEEVVNEVRGQLEAFEGFESQEKKISGLQERVREGREKIEILGGRVEVIRLRVESWEKRDSEWKERTRRRLRLLWAIISVAAVMFLLRFLYSPSRAQKGVVMGTNTSNVPHLGELGDESLQAKNKTSSLLELLRNQEEGELEEDPRLTIFDEL